VPDSSEKVHQLDPAGDIDDPIGSGAAVYDKCARRIRQCIVKRLDELGV
jgi:hypothetical protein